MSKESKAYYYLARQLALSNAAEFIRSHGEEGHSFINEKLNNEYQKQIKTVAAQLESRAFSFVVKFEEMNIEIDTETD